jgi:ADP-ribose pyrophosphatase
VKRRVTGIETTVDEELNPSGFLRLQKLTCRNRYEDGSLSRPYRSEVVHRRGWDSVAIFPYWTDGATGELVVVVARGIRPAPWLRRTSSVPFEEPGTGLYVFEAVAGSLEPGDSGEDGIDRRASIELLEETGYEAPAGSIERLGAGILPSHGQSTEKVHLRAVRVGPNPSRAPQGDGSVGEEDSTIEPVAASRLIAMCESGEVQDPKIEVGVTRLIRRLGYSR